MQFLATITRSSLVAGTAILLAGFAGCGSNEYVEPPPPEVEVAHPVQRTITRSLEYTGTTAPFKTVEIQARVKGFLDTRNFDEGDDEIKENDVLYVIDQEPFKVKVEQAAAAIEMAKADRLSANAQLSSAQAQKQNAEVQLQLNRAAGGAVTTAEIKALEAAVNVATAEVDAAIAAQASAASELAAAKAALAEAELDLSYTEVRSPIDGRVGRTLVDVGNLVGANETTHLTTVINYSPIYAYFTVSELAFLDYLEWKSKGLVPAGDSAEPKEVFLGLANEQGFPHRGLVQYADLAVDESSGTYLIRAVFDNPEMSIPPGAFVRIKVPLFPEDVLLVDEAAVGRDQAGSYVLIVNAGSKVERRAVEVGERYDGMRVVESGLSTDDWVVVNGIQWARPGREVKTSEVEMAPPVEQVVSAEPSEGAASEDSPPMETE